MMVKKLMKRNYVFPNEEIGDEKDFQIGFGVYAKNGKLYSKQLGYVVIDEETKEISVFPLAGGG